MLNCEKQERGDVTIVVLKGTLDLETSPGFRDEAEGLAAADRRKVVLDLEGLELIDSTGVAAIVSLRNRLRDRHGEMKIAGMHDQPFAIFRVLRMDRAFDFCSNTEIAVTQFNQ